MSKFAGPTSNQQNQSRSRSTTTRHYSSSSYATNSGPTQTNTRSFATNSVTYSALPKSHEPPVNSLEYYQMQQLSGSPFTNIQQAAAPIHIQHSPYSPTGLNALRDRFKTGSLSDDYNRPQVVNRQAPPPPQQRQQQQQQHHQQQGTGGGNSLSSLRNQYAARAKESSQSELPPQPVQNIPRTIVGEDIPQQKTASQAPPPQQQPPATVLQAPQNNQPQNENLDQQQQQQQESSAPPTEDPNNAAEGVSSF
jgi:hypothetical protein